MGLYHNLTGQLGGGDLQISVAYMAPSKTKKKCLKQSYNLRGVSALCSIGHGVVSIG
jgi:hypothetical protein